MRRLPLHLVHKAIITALPKSTADQVRGPPPHTLQVSVQLSDSSQLVRHTRLTAE